MTSLKIQWLIPAVLGGFLIGSGLIGQAQESDQPGILRISSARASDIPVQNAGHHKHNAIYDNGMVGGDYPCPEMAGPCRYGCPKGHCWHGHCCHHKHWCCEHYGCHSPDYGFSVPEKNPIYRRGVQYNRYFPAGWYGTPGGGITPGVIYPTIYQPTDTTQLGFYYQHVPFWMPNPNALPPRPIPSQWHVLLPPAQPNIPYSMYGYHSCWHHGKGFHKWGRKGKGGIDCPPDGDVWADGAEMIPGDAQSAPSSTDPTPIPSSESAVNDSAENLNIRRAALNE